MLWGYTGFVVGTPKTDKIVYYVTDHNTGFERSSFKYLIEVRDKMTEWIICIVILYI